MKRTVRYTWAYGSVRDLAKTAANVLYFLESDGGP